MWPKVVEQVPDAELHIYYDMDGWLRQISQIMAVGHTPLTGDRAVEIQGLLPNTPNMTYHGGVSKTEIAAALLSAKVMAYPCEPVAPTEGFSMTSLESWIAGCSVVISDADALQELWGHRDGVTCLPLPVEDDLWVDQIVKGLKSDIPTGPRLVPGDLTWEYKAQQWEEEVERCR
jgi:glycosyltransferase involved in cell wall biosynthesis